MAEDWRSRIYQTYNLIGSWIGQPEVLMPIDDGGPGPAPAPEVVGVVDSDGCSALRSVEALVAAEGASIPIPGAMPGEPAVGNVVIPRKFQTAESVAALPEGEDKVIATLSLNAAAFHQNRVVRYTKPAAWQFWLRGYQEGDTVPNAVSYNGSAADLAKAIVGRARRIKAGTPGVLHFLALNADDLAAGA